MERARERDSQEESSQDSTHSWGSTKHVSPRWSSQSRMGSRVKRIFRTTKTHEQRSGVFLVQGTETSNLDLRFKNKITLAVRAIWLWYPSPHRSRIALLIWLARWGPHPPSPLHGHPSQICVLGGIGWSSPTEEDYSMVKHIQIPAVSYQMG